MANNHFEFPNVGAGDWVDITPLERKRNLDFSSFVFKWPLINRVQRCFRWPIDKVHLALAEYMRLLMLKEELGDTEGHIVVVPPVIARVWECHLIDTADYQACMDKIMGPGVFYNYNPEMTGAFEEVFKKEKVSQLEMFYRGKYGHDPDPFYWGFESPAPLNANNNNNNNNSGSSLAPPSRFPRGCEDCAAASFRRQANASSQLPVGSGRFPRDGGGVLRHGRLDRPPRPRSPAFRGKWREDDEFGERSKGGAESGLSPYRPKLENFIGEYRGMRKDSADADVQVEDEGGEKEEEEEEVRQGEGQLGGTDGILENAGGREELQRPPMEGADPGPMEEIASLGADSPVAAARGSGRLINFIIKCKEPRVRLVITDWQADSKISDLKSHILSLSSDQIRADFHLTILGKRIDLDDAKTLADVGALDGDIIAIEPVKWPCL